MNFLKYAFAIVCAVTVSGCATTSTTRLAQNVVRIDASAAPACGAAGAMALVNRMAAVETIRLGYDKYYIAAMDAQNNVRVIAANYRTTGNIRPSPTGATFTGTTTANPIVTGSRDASVVAVMFKKNDPEGRNALDARQALGPGWQDVVAKGSPTTCIE